MPSIPAGAFDIHERLAAGGAGEVWYGTHRSLHVPVAVKILADRFELEDRWLRAFTAEVRAVAGLTHDGIVTVLDYGRLTPGAVRSSKAPFRPGSPYLVMELADGTLRDRGRKMFWKQIRTMLVSVLEALAHAHARGVVHRDLKPANILWWRQDIWKLADFGIAHALGTTDDKICGTPRYMSPEQFDARWRDFGPWTDLYALGCVTWEIVSGKPVFSGSIPELYRAHHEEKPGAFETRLDLPADLGNWLRKLLAKRPRDRYASAADALYDLNAMASHQGPAAPSSERIPMPVAWRRPDSKPSHPHLFAAGLGLYGLRALRMVGRVPERDALWAALGRVHRSQRLHVALLRGTAGSGKSRLASWLAERAHEVGAARTLRAVHGSPAGRHDGLVEMISSTLRCGGLEAEKVYVRVAEFLGRGAEVDAASLTELVRPSGMETDTVATQRARWMVIGQFLSSFSRRRPAIVWLDDIQWGHDLVGFVDYMRRAHANDSLLIIMTARDDLVVAMPRLENALDELMSFEECTEIRVGQLQGADRRALVQEMLGLRKGLAAEVEERTAGNPLFAVQLVGDWVQRGLLVVGEDGFELRDGANVEIPDAIHTLWSSRVADLMASCTRPERRALELAAVMGHRVDQEEWTELCRRSDLPVPLQLPERMETLQLAIPHEGGWAFTHRMLVESIVRRVSEADRIDAYRATCSGLLYELGTERQEVGQHLEASKHLVRARSLGEGGDAQHQGRVLYALGRAQFAVGMPQQAREAMSAALEFLEGDLERARAHAQLGVMHQRLRNDEESREQMQLAMDLNTTLRDDWVRSQALTGMAYYHLYRGEWELAEAAIEPVIEQARQQGDRHGEAMALTHLGQTLVALGRWEEATATSERARALLEELGDPRQLAKALHNLANVKRQVRDVDAAKDLLEQAISLHRASHNLTSLANSLGSLANVHAERGDYPSAVELYRESADMDRDMARDINRARTLANLCELYAEQGEFHLGMIAIEEATELLGVDVRMSPLLLCQRGILYTQMRLYTRAEKCFARSLAGFREIEDPLSEAAVLTEQGNARMLEGRFEAARQLLEQALADDRFAPTSDAMHTRECLAEVLHVAGERAQAWRDLRAIETEYRSLDQPPKLARVACRRGRMKRAEGDEEAALEAADEAVRLVEGLGFTEKSQLFHEIAALRSPG